MESTLGLIGVRIGNYRVLSQIGQGGMGAVYLADHQILGRKAAVKVLLPELSKDPDLIGRFFNEARATAQLRHRGFVEIFDSGTLPGGSAYLVMDFLRGANLASCIEHNRVLSPADAVEILRDVAASVGIAHRHGIVHRDLKPDNIFLAIENDGASGLDQVVVKVLDFGIAKLNTTDAEAAHARPSRTRTGTLLGTPLFMSPEQCRGAGHVDHRSDIYSLGCIAYNMLAGRPPFGYEGFGEIISAHLTERAAPLRTVAPQVPEALDRFVQSLLAKSPGDRPPTMEAVVMTLDALRPQVTGGPRAGLRALIPAHASRTEVQGDAGGAPRFGTTPFPQGARTPQPPSGGSTTPFPQGAAPNASGAWIGQSGETRLLPSQPGARPLPISTLGATAGELGSSRRRGEQRRGGMPAALALVGIAALGGAGFLYFHGAPGAGPRPVPAPERPPVDPPSLPSPAAPDRAPPPPEPSRTPPRAESGESLQRDAQRTVEISSEPSHATVTDAKTGKLLGTTPFSLPVARATGTFISVRKRGYHGKELRLTGDEQTAAVTLERKSTGDTRPGEPVPDDDQRKL